MARRVLILDGHPDPDATRFGHALAGAYREGAAAGGHEVLTVRVADIDFPLLRTQMDYEKGDPIEAVRQCQSAFDWAQHVVIFYPLWLGGMPAVLKGLLEQMLRPGFAFSTLKLGRWPVKLQGGKSARIVVTMGMPGWWYRWYFRAHSLRSLQRNMRRTRLCRASSVVSAFPAWLSRSGRRTIHPSSQEVPDRYSGNGEIHEGGRALQASGRVGQQCGRRHGGSQAHARGARRFPGRARAG